MKNMKLLDLLKILLVLLIIVVFVNFAVKYNIFKVILSLFTTLLPFFVALFIAWMMKPFGRFLNKKFGIPIKGANIIAVLVNLIIVLGFLFVFIPVFIFQLAALIKISPALIEGINQNLDKITDLVRDNQETIKDAYEQIKDYIVANAAKWDLTKITTDTLNTVFEAIFVIIKSIFNSIFSFFFFIGQIVVAYIIAFYFVNDINSFVDKLLAFSLGKKYPQYRPVIIEMSSTLFNYLRGLLIDCTLLAIIISIWCYFLGIPSPIFFGIVAGIFNVIPYLGPVLGGIPIFFAALSQSWIIALVSAVLVLITQTFEANIMQPRIMASAVNLHPVSIIVGLLIFASLFGFIGMIIATPVLAMFNVVLINSKYDIHL